MDKQVAEVMRAMVAYDHGDARRIQHFIKVHDLAATIGVSEGLNAPILFTLEVAAILHDIGIHAAEQKYGNCNGKAQKGTWSAASLQFVRPPQSPKGEDFGLIMNLELGGFHRILHNKNRRAATM